MYLNSDTVYKVFTVKSRQTALNARGRQIRESGEELATFKGALSQASENDIDRYKQMQHVITHTIVQKGQRAAEQNDILILNGTNRMFIVKDVNNPGEIKYGLGAFTTYQVEERRDIDA